MTNESLAQRALWEARREARESDERRDDYWHDVTPLFIDAFDAHTLTGADLADALGAKREEPTMTIEPYAIAKYLTDEQKQRAVAATYRAEVDEYSAYMPGPPRTERYSCPLGEAFYDCFDNFPLDEHGLGEIPADPACEDFSTVLVSLDGKLTCSVLEPAAASAASIIRYLSQDWGDAFLDITEAAWRFIHDFDEGKLLGENLAAALGVRGA